MNTKTAQGAECPGSGQPGIHLAHLRLMQCSRCVWAYDTDLYLGKPIPSHLLSQGPSRKNGGHGD